MASSGNKHGGRCGVVLLPAGTHGRDSDSKACAPTETGITRLCEDCMPNTPEKKEFPSGDEELIAPVMSRQHMWGGKYRMRLRQGHGKRA